MQQNKNVLLATVLSAVILLSWTWFYERPRIEKQEAQKKLTTQTKPIVETVKPVEGKDGKTVAAVKPQEAIPALKNRDEILAQSANSRVKIESESLNGSISLKGARFDDLKLAKYFVTPEKKEEVVLLAPAESKERYFTDFGWVSSDASLETPKPDSLWKSNGSKLTPENPITLSWKSSQNVEFFITVSLDENYMFDVTQTVKNHSGKEISLAAYGRVNRVMGAVHPSNYVLHEGPIGVFSDVLHETSYQKMTKEKHQDFESKSGGWIGITDKYWLNSIIPDKDFSYKASFDYSISNHSSIYNSEFVGQEFTIPQNEELKFDHKFFAGAKSVKLLDAYSEKYDIMLFDRAVDFGWFYFMTKPFFFIIEFLSSILGNFGLAILAMTVLIKLALFPMATKSYVAINKIKVLHPKIEELRTRFKDDKMALNRETMELYKREKVNPASGCLPILIQIPVFFALYKVLFVTLDMRQAPFYGWIHDLSAPDSTSIFNLFGLLPFKVSHTFTIGVWPILMGITMIIQQKLNPAASDPTQAKVLKWMPYILTFVLAAFPAGLVIYWTWSNTLSILQQWYISKKFAKPKN